jgi:CPA2 family monovalent cation:H+ antiporter-2
MEHETTLIALLAVGFALAFAFGFVAARLRMPPLVGYLVAGIVIGPFTPGFVGDTETALELAEVGVMLLMFGVGMHFSIRDLLAVRRVGIPGALVQIIVATLLGMVVASRLFGWSIGSGIIYGLCLSVASTVVLLRTLESRGRLDAPEGRIAVGWLIMEDLITILVLVLLPALAQIGEFSFILAGMGLSLGLLSPEGLSLVVAGALISIVLNPFLFAAAERLDDRRAATLSQEAA